MMMVMMMMTVPSTRLEPAKQLMRQAALAVSGVDDDEDDVDGGNGGDCALHSAGTRQASHVTGCACSK